MMINLKLPDELYDRYLQQYGAPKHYTRMKEALEAFAQVPSNDRAIFLFGDDRKAIEGLFQTPIDNGPQLAKLVKNLCTVRIGGIEVSFTADQLARIAMQASFHGRTPETFIREMVTEIVAKFMEEV